MDLKEIKQIVDLMKRTGLTQFEIEEKDFKLRICRGNGGVNNPPAPVITAPAAVTEAPPAPAVPTVNPASEGKFIKSPMVGTFYSAPNPDAAAFVKTGDRIDPESVVCIIEAMKVMNEIKAEISGKIVEVLVANGDSVEYGQPLFRVA